MAWCLEENAGVSRGLDWLRERINQLTDGRLVLMDRRLFSRREVGQLDRCVIPCATRLGYPSEFVQVLEREYPDVPFALATDNWWDGSRRTGLGTLTHLALPWYRWWDGWSAWLSDCPVGMMGPLVSPVSFATSLVFKAQLDTVQPDAVQPDASPSAADTNGLVISNCFQAAQAWQLAARSVGFHAMCCTWAQWVDDRRELSNPPWILWDDSCVDTSIADPMDIASFIRPLRQAYPNALVCVTMSMPRMETWDAAQQAGADELLVKPNSGNALQRMLVAQQLCS
ncbi:MAG: hypothetical protein KDB22_27810 [Planctomycetales bacterium]|nr:hypothetical protein [Planctomycetales bacterium]